MMGGQQAALASQDTTLKLQAFESTFFQLLRLQDDIVNAIDLKVDGFALQGQTPPPETTVEDCTFFDAQGSVFFNGIETGIVRRCTFSADANLRSFIMVTQGSYGVIEDRHFLESPRYFGVDVVSA